MKKKSLKKFLALLLATVTVFAGCGQAATDESVTEPENVETAEEAEETEYPEYLNLDGAYPIIKDEYAEDVTLTMAILMQDGAGEWDNLWISKYLSDKYNINIEVEALTPASMVERKNLILASGELPDIMINCAFSTSELIKYGVQEELLLQMDSYMNETLTPNILKYMQGEVEAMCTATDGHIYTLPVIQNVEEPNNNVVGRVFINNAWLESLGLDTPKTLDDFVSAMYAIKEADPAGVGSDNLYPMGADVGATNVTGYLLNAFGYIRYERGEDATYGLKASLRDGEVVIPVYDMDVFKEYLSLLNQFYTDGILAPTYFTMESTELNTYMCEGRTAMYGSVPYLSGCENPDDYVACIPLTSDWQTEPEAAALGACTIGGFVIAADTEYPEVCLRLADAFFNNTDDYCAAFGGGYGIDSEYSYGYLAKEYDPETGTYAVDSEKTPGGISSWEYVVQHLAGNTWNVGAVNAPESLSRLVSLQGYDGYDGMQPTTGQNSWRISVGENVMPYTVSGYPTAGLYATDEQNERITYLESVLYPYVKEQVALFITGERDLSEVDAFKEELTGLGMDELQQIYVDLYNNSAFAK